MDNVILAKDAETVFIGLDVHHKQYTVTCRERDTVVKRCQVPASPETLLGFIRKFFPERRVKTAYEAGFSGFALHRYLLAHGIDSIVVHAGSVEVSNKKSKTDKRDSARLAEQLEDGRLSCIDIPSEEQELRRVITRTRAQLVKKRSRLMIQCRMRLHQFGLIPREFKGVFSRSRIEEFVESGLERRLAMAMQGALRLLERIENEIKVLNKEIRAIAKEDPNHAIYRQVPGFGLLAASILSNEIGNLSQFANERRLFSFTGLIPSEKTSDKSRHLGHITRQGKSTLRHVLVEAAWVAIRKDPALAATFNRIARGKSKKRAIIAIARKLIGRARALFKKKEDYKFNFPKAA